MSVVLVPGTTPLSVLRDIWANGHVARLDPAARPGVEAAAALIARAAAGEDAVYGVNTGFGKLASVKIASRDTTRLQRNLILSHCCGVGTPLDAATTRLMMVLKLLSLGRGASGVVWPTIALIEELLARGVTPVIPDQGSVGASGDLAPLAHMAAVMIGEGEAVFDGARMCGDVALRKAGLTPIELGPKEGLALINGTQFSTACALVGLWGAFANAAASVVTAALMSENKHLANPCTTDSTPTSANQEDHVSMAAHAARRLARMNANLNVILGVEAICGAQGIAFRRPLETSAPLKAVIATLRTQVAELSADRYMAPSLEAAAAMIADGRLVAAAGLPPFVQGHAA